MSRKKNLWFIITLFLLVASPGLNSGKAKIINGEESDPDSLSLADFPDIPGVTQEYVAAYKLFLKAKAGDNQESNYASAASSFEKIAETTGNPELKLRALYLITFCRFLQLNISDAYKSGMEVLSLGKNLYKEDKRIVFLDKVISAIRSGEIGETGDLKEIMETSGTEAWGEKAAEVSGFAEDGFLFQERVKEYEEMKKKIKKQG